MRTFLPPLIATALAALAGGCTTLAADRVAGWPELRIVEHRVPHAQMRTRCSPYVAFGFSPEACVEFDFVAAECHVWLSSDFPPHPAVVEHERLHCRGHEHAGDDAMGRSLQRHRALAAARP